MIVSGDDANDAAALYRIRQVGGITIAQKLHTATPSEMSDSVIAIAIAIAGGCIDFVLLPENSVKEFSRVARIEHLIWPVKHAGLDSLSPTTESHWVSKNVNLSRSLPLTVKYDVQWILENAFSENALCQVECSASHL